MKRAILVLIIVLLALSTWGCKTKKSGDTPYYPDDGDIEYGDGFDFYGDGVNIGGKVVVTPAELLRLGVRFQYDFLKVIADVQGFWPHTINLELRKEAGGSAVLGSKKVYTEGIQALPAGIINYVLDRSAATYYLVACAGGFGDVKCSGANRLTYLGEEGSQIITQTPNLYSCVNTTVSFSLSGVDPYNDFYPIINGILPQVVYYRSTVDFSDPEDAQDKKEAAENFWCDCYSSTCSCHATIPGSGGNYVGIRVRDFDGRLSPMSNVRECEWQ